MSEPSAGWIEGREHQLPVRIYYEDTDFTGMVYHANYLRYFERGRSDYMRLIGVDHTSLLNRPDNCTANYRTSRTKGEDIGENGYRAATTNRRDG